MQQYQVPQFIDVKDNIALGLSLKQFLSLIGIGALGYLLKKILPSFLFYILAVPVGGLVAALLFVKVNGRPFSAIFLSAGAFYIRNHLYLWKKEQKQKKGGQEIKVRIPTQKITRAPEQEPRLTPRHLNDLAWSLDIHKILKR